MAYITDNKYYNNDGTVPTNSNWGSYQYVPFTEIVNNFLYMYIGDDKLINNVKRSTVIFHAKRAIQELNYDAFNSICVLEELLTDNLQMILPSDYSAVGHQYIVRLNAPFNSGFAAAVGTAANTGI